MEIETLSAAKLQSLHEKRQRASSAICDAMIAAGRGHERSTETREKAKAVSPDALTLEFVRVSDAVFDTNAEMQRRREYSGTLKPIRK